MGRTDEHRTALRALPAGDWDRYLTERSGLPGPRANLELVAAVASEAPAATVRRYAASDDEFLALCGAAGLGRLLAAGDPAAAGELARLAGDDRWRVREGVAMGLQRLGDADLPRLLELARAWAASPSPLVQRAAVAGVCEPRLLGRPGPAAQALDLLDEVTGSLAARPAAERAGPGVRALRKALGYCWSVAVAALPADGFARLERWAASGDPDVRWMVRENLGKSRLARADPARLAALRDLAGLAPG
jgi:hypothetical protein